MPAVIEDNIFVEQFQQRAARKRQPDWLEPIRRVAMERFAGVGFPTTQHEDWRFTNLAPIARTPFVPGKPVAVPEASALADYSFGEAQRLVFLNGRFCPELSSMPAMQGVRLINLAAALQGNGELVRDHLARLATEEGHPFAALNTAFFEDGAVVRATSDVDDPAERIRQPLHILHLTMPGPEPIAVHPRTLIVLERGALLTVVERHVALGEGVYFTNPVTQIVAGAGARLTYYRVQQDSLQGYHVGTIHLQQGRDSFVGSVGLDFGAALARNNLHAVLAGEGAEAALHGLYMVGGRQHVDNHLRVEHVRPHCDSREYYKGILDGQAHGVFTGRIVVHKDAQKTDAKQTNKNLLLSEECQVDTKPQLEIFADDVKCTHGATIGQLDEDSLFYLRARGISLADARNLLVYAFASEILADIGIEPLRGRLQELLFARLPGGERLKEAV